MHPKNNAHSTIAKTPFQKPRCKNSIVKSHAAAHSVSGEAMMLDLYACHSVMGRPAVLPM